MRTSVALLTLLLAGGVALADPPAPAPAAPGAPAAAPAKPSPPKHEQAAEAVLAAIRAKDDAALKALAAKDEPDPWLVADELIRRGEFDAADAFAKAAPRVDVATLPEYVVSRRGKPDDAARRARLAAANAALAARKPHEALDPLGPPDPGAIGDVVGIRLSMARGSSLASIGTLEASAAAYLTAGEAAERIGWLARASHALNQAGASAYRGSALAKAQEAGERRLLISQKRGDKAGAASTLGNLGIVYRALGEYSKALATLERALAAKDALGDRAGAARTLGDVGTVHGSLGNYAKALATFERAFSEMEALGDTTGAAGVLGNIGNVHCSLGDYPRALATYERALTAMESLRDKAGAATTLGNLGTVYNRLGAYAKALATFERALAAKDALGDRAGSAATLCNIGIVYYWLGDHARALATYQRALSAQEALGDKVGAADTLGNVGNVCYSLGDYAKALATYERALSAMEALGDKAAAARTRVGIGNVYQSLGDYARALAIFERALATQETLGDMAGAAVTLGNIGNAYRSLGDYAKALAAHERSLAAKEALGDMAGTALTLGNIAGVYVSLGEHAKALATFERALSAMEALGDKDGVAWALCHIGAAYQILGNHAKAIEFGERAVRASEKLGANRRLVEALGVLASARLRSGNAAGAISEAHRAVSLMETLVGGLGEEQGAMARGQYTSLFSMGLAVAATVNDVSEATFFLESGRAGTLLESLGSRESLRAALLPEGLRVADNEARARESRALVAYTKSHDSEDLATTRAAREGLEAARAGVAEVAERIQRDAKKAARVIYPKAASIARLQSSLSTGEALVLYGLGEKDGPAHALVLTMGAARLVVLGKSSQITAACEALDASDSASDPAAALDRLRDLVVKPLALAKETKRLLVSPEGPLSYVPFSALLPDLDVVYEPSGTTYGVLLEEKDKHGARVLALGDPDYTAKFDPTALDVYAPLAMAKTPDTRGGRLARLPGTREEAMAVADVCLFGADASEAGLRDALAKAKERWRAVHFACHGLVNPDRPTLSSLALTPDATNDGFLTALEVLRMEIPSDLVVLSACETGKGKIVGGEGIVGLTRAFMFAGAPRVICSLWKVDDDATKALMVKFYELWNPKDGKPGLPTAEALRKAQEFVRSHEKWKHPYYWAAWVLWGLPS